MKVIQRKFMSLCAAVVIFVSSVNLVLAQQDVTPVGDEGHQLVEWVTTMLQWLIALAGVVAAAVLIFNGYTYITASGDEQKIQKATKGITYAIVGLIIAAVAFLIVNFVINQLTESTSMENLNFDKKVELVS